MWVRNASRLSRKDPDEPAYYRHLLKMWGWTVRYAEGDEVQEPTGRAVNRAIQAIQAHSESVNRSIRVKDGQRSEM